MTGLPIPAVTMRRLALGDRWGYTATGTLTRPDGAVLPVAGTIAVEIVPDTLTNRPGGLAIAFAQHLAATTPDGTAIPLPAPPLMFAIIQDSTTTDVAISADTMTPDGSARIAREPQVFYPGQWSATTGYDNRLDFGPAGTVVNFLKTTGPEWVDVPLGRFAAWACVIGSESAAGRIEGRDWWTPELGAPIQFEFDSPTPDGARLRFTAGMSATTVR